MHGSDDSMRIGCSDQRRYHALGSAALREVVVRNDDGTVVRVLPPMPRGSVLFGQGRMRSQN
jgi:hypothetical protein